MKKLMLIVLILFITIDIVYSRNGCACTAHVDPVCSTTNETHSNEGCLLCAHQVLACHRECPCVRVSVNATVNIPYSVLEYIVLVFMAVDFDNSIPHIAIFDVDRDKLEESGAHWNADDKQTKQTTSIQLNLERNENINLHIKG